MDNIGSSSAAAAMEASERDMRRKPKTVSEKNVAAYRKYEKAQEAAKRKKERAERGVIRAALILTRSREKLRYIERQLTAIREAVEKGQHYRPKREPKKKAGRVIQLED
jgi:hypothetical protein